MADFNDVMRKQLIDRFGHIEGVGNGNMVVDELLKQALANPGIQNAASQDYTRTYTEADYTRYDRTQTGKTMIDIPDDFDDDFVRQIIKGIEE